MGRSHPVQAITSIIACHSALDLSVESAGQRLLLTFTVHESDALILSCVSDDLVVLLLLLLLVLAAAGAAAAVAVDAAAVIVVFVVAVDTVVA